MSKDEKKSGDAKKKHDHEITVMYFRQFNYSYKKLLGSGEFGTVYLCETEDGREVAVKMMKKQDFTTREWECSQKIREFVFFFVFSDCKNCAVKALS